MAVRIKEFYINKTDGHRYGESEIVDSGCQNIGELFKKMLKKHGRCISKMYQDTPLFKAMHIGWVFQKKQCYSDISNKKYLAETWVEVIDTILSREHG